MPELPEVETVRRGLQPAMEGAKIVHAEARRKDLRFPFQKDFVARLEGQTVTGLGRRAKYLMADLASGDVLLMHLGMSGSFRVVAGGGNSTPGKFHHPRSEDRAHDHVVFHMSSGATVVFNDPRRFGYMKIFARDKIDDEPLLQGLGPEPLGNEFDARMLARACHNKKTSLKAALLDQRVVAGLGNIYVCEALYRAHLSPRRLAATLSTKKGEPTGHAVTARSSPDLRRAGPFPAFLPGLRPRGQTVCDRRLRRHGAPLHAERQVDVLVPEMPEVNSRSRPFVTARVVVTAIQGVSHPRVVPAPGRTLRK
jgi:formamidopyrimidine-DNA glycosylase